MKPARLGLLALTVVLACDDPTQPPATRGASPVTETAAAVAGFSVRNLGTLGGDFSVTGHEQPESHRVLPDLRPKRREALAHTAGHDDVLFRLIAGQRLAHELAPLSINRARLESRGVEEKLSAQDRFVRRGRGRR